MSAGASKKETRKNIEARLEKALAGLSKDISEKKFRKHLRKAGKILSDGLHIPAKKPAKKKSAATAKKSLTVKVKNT
jgi:hypothetical protein